MTPDQEVVYIFAKLAEFSKKFSSKEDRLSYLFTLKALTQLWEQSLSPEDKLSIQKKK